LLTPSWIESPRDDSGRLALAVCLADGTCLEAVVFTCGRSFVSAAADPTNRVAGGTDGTTTSDARDTAPDVSCVLAVAIAAESVTTATSCFENFFPASSRSGGSNLDAAGFGG